MKSAIDKTFPIQWTFRSRLWGFSPLIFFRYRLKCWLTHPPLTRKFFPIYKFHDLDCSALVICPLDGWSDDPNDIEHALRSDGIWNDTNGKEERL